MRVEFKLVDILNNSTLCLVGDRLYIRLPGIWSAGPETDAEKQNREQECETLETIVPQGTKRRGRPPKASTLGRFDDWYQHYPRKVARGQAEKAWASLNPSDELVATMVTAIKAQRWEDPSYIPHPATWLNGKRWMDEVPGQQQEQALPYAGKPWAQFIKTGSLAEVLNLMAQVGVDDAEAISDRLDSGDTVEQVCDWLWSFRATIL